MQKDEILYIKLNRMKQELERQIIELDEAIELARPKDDVALNIIANNLMIGLYDFPTFGLLQDMVWFALQKLKVANTDEIIRYLKMVGQPINDINQYRNNIDHVLNQMVDQNKLEICGTNDDKFRLKKG